MYTQDVGNDIAADVTFEYRIGPVFTPTYEFKGTIAETNVIGSFLLTIQRGDGIDIAHAEVVVEQGASPTSIAAVPGIVWTVTELTATADGEARFLIRFTRMVFDSTPAPDTITPTGINPSWASITVRRKTPSVN
jgi:hypothetical protein